MIVHCTILWVWLHPGPALTFKKRVGDMQALMKSLGVVVLVAVAFACGVISGLMVLGLSAQFFPGDAAGTGGPGSAGGPPGGGGPPPAIVRVVQSEMKPVQERFRVVGRLRELRRATVAAEVEGRVMNVAIEEGDPVIGGQTVLAKIDDVWAKADLAAAQANVAEAQASLEQARLDLAILEDLQAAQSAKPREVQEQRNLVQQREAGLARAEAQLQRVKSELQRVTILAPFDGVVVRKFAETGQWMSPGTEVAEIISTGKIDARLNVPERLINELNVGDDMRIVIEPLNRMVSGQIVAINPAGDNAARTFPVDVRLDDEDGALKLGMSVEGFIAVGQEQPTMLLPRDAVLTRQGRSDVWIGMPQDEGGLPIALPMPVRILYGIDAQTLAVEPLPNAQGMTLQPGMSVVIEGAERIMFPTQPLLYQDTQGNTQPPPEPGPATAPESTPGSTPESTSVNTTRQRDSTRQAEHHRSSTHDS